MAADPSETTPNASKTDGDLTVFRAANVAGGCATGCIDHAPDVHAGPNT